MEFIIVLLICLSITYFLSWLYRKIGLPHILGHLTTGLIISIPAVSRFLFDSSTEATFQSLFKLGLIFLLFFIGLKINLTKLIKFSKKSVNIAIMSAIVPFILGFSCGRLLQLDLFASIVLGASLSVTSEAVLGAILEELKMVNTRIGMIVLEAGIIDDIFEVLILAIVGTVVQSHESGSTGFEGVGSIFLQIILFIIIIYIVRFIFIPITFKLLDKKPSHSDLFTASFIVVLLMATISNWLRVASIIGVLIAGIIVKQTLLLENKRKEEAEVVDIVETLTFGFLEPVFFIWIAYQADIWHQIAAYEYFLPTALFITAAATGGKLLGSIIGNVLDKGTIKEGILIGWGMNSRGAVELIVMQLALDKMLIPEVIFSSVVFMTFMTTLISPILFKSVAKYHKTQYVPSE